AIVLIYTIYRLVFKKSTKPTLSNYQIFSKSRLFHPEYYPLNRTVDSRHYQPVAEWSGRLILPLKDPNGEPFVKFEVHNAPATHQYLIGKVVTLKWSSNHEVQEYVKQVTMDVNFTEKAKKSHRGGKVHPVRLDGCSQVDPLESLAGARPIDDVYVKLNNPIVATYSQDEVELRIEKEPIQVTGRFVGLVKIEERKAPTSDYFIVRHYNKATKSFADGDREVIHIPQVLEDQRGVPRSTNYHLEKSRFNSQGWYIYGAPDATGMFVVQAIEPRALFQLEPQQVISNPTEAHTYLHHKMWANIKAQKGKISSILLAPNAETAEAAISQWCLGDKALLIHAFGGIGGKKAENRFSPLVTGHFCYGVAEVVKDLFTDELRFDIIYYQVYTHNTNAILSGAQNWATYMGSLWLGWLGNRPVSDILVKFAPVTTDYDFGKVKLSPLEVFIREITEMMARYRVGDGTGASLITPATSCVQDSNQALYVTIRRIEQMVVSNTAILEYIERNPDTPQVNNFKALIALGKVLEKQLVPLGVLRLDWDKNIRNLSGTGDDSNLFTAIIKALSSWRTILPRTGQDTIAKIFLQQGADEWVLRTNQVGGFDPDIKPLAPTGILGRLMN
ncbi:MAG: CPBP family intramembrane glutamate endopeptidase, partial [Scytonema sp. PMC 1069.18]|nr:CPBP family intramembrane glutamate endopeptidase [Scytonema sp. PMC 1069.18]